MAIKKAKERNLPTLPNIRWPYTALLHSPLKGIKLAEKAVRFSSQRISQRKKKRNNMMKSQPKHNKEIRLDIV